MFPNPDSIDALMPPPAWQRNAAPADNSLVPWDSTLGLHAPDFEIFFDMKKSVQGSDGKIWIEGIASDQSSDLDGEMVKAIAYPPAIEYLNKFGKFNWDHRNSIIGDITEARFIHPDEAKSKYGILVKGTSVWIRGWVMPLDADPHDADLREAHKFLKSGSKLGFSMQGIYADQKAVKNAQGQDVIVAVPGFVHQVALCPQPKNGNAACFRKSLSQLLMGGQVENRVLAAAPKSLASNHAASREYSWPVVMCSADGECGEPAMNKGLATTGVLAEPGVGSGDAMKLEDLGGLSQDRTQKKCDCAGCKCHDDDEDEVRAALQAKALKKSLHNLLDTLQA